MLLVARRFVSEYSVVRLSIGEALRTVLDTQPNTELSRCILSYLHEGHAVPDELAVHALEIALMDIKCKTRGYVLLPRASFNQAGPDLISRKLPSLSSVIPKSVLSLSSAMK